MSTGEIQRRKLGKQEKKFQETKRDERETAALTKTARKVDKGDKKPMRKLEQDTKSYREQKTKKRAFWEDKKSLPRK